MLDSSEVIDLRARLEAAERERDELRLAVESEMRKTIKAHADLYAAESALGACREALEYEVKHGGTDHDHDADEAGCDACIVLADTTAAAAQRDERLRAEMKERCAKVADEREYRFAELADELKGSKGRMDSSGASLKCAGTAMDIAARIRALGREPEAHDG